MPCFEVVLMCNRFSNAYFGLNPVKKNKMQKRKYILSFLIFIACLAFANADVLNPVKWQITGKQINQQTIRMNFKAQIDKNWHLYGSEIVGEGPVPTTVFYDDTTLFKSIGSLVPDHPPESVYDPNFGIKLPFYDHTVTFTQTLTTLDAVPSKITGFIEFMCCDDKTCIPPAQEEFSVQFNKKSSREKTSPGTSEKENQSVQLSESQIELNLNTNKDTGSGQKNDTVKKEPLTIATAEQEKKPEERSLWIFFLLSLLGGLGGIITPCVFPMIPMTISFFMRSNESRIKSVFSSFVFSFSIILIFIGIGLLVSLTSLGADFTKQISSHWIPNILFFILFIFFTLWFFGVFEIVMPGNIVNKTDKKADKGGIVGAFFMAVTLVLVSFSCTGPIIGAILIKSAGGLAVKPVIGMLGYSLGFALPFFLLSLFPSALKTLPKSGGWLNSVKVVFGFILLALSLVFLNNIDQSYHLQLLNRNVYLAAWISIFTLMGLYLLGKIRMKHDAETSKINTLRLILAIITFTFVVYLIPGLFGAPLKNLSTVLPPKSISGFDLTKNTRPSPVYTDEAHPTFCGDAKYDDILHSPHGLKGYFDYQQGLACARKHDKPLLIIFKGHFCSKCKEMESKVLSDPRVLEKLKKQYVLVSLYVDDRTKLPEDEWVVSKDDGKIKKTIGKKALDIQIANFNANTQPFFVIINPRGEMLSSSNYTLSINAFIDFLDEGVEKFENN